MIVPHEKTYKHSDTNPNANLNSNLNAKTLTSNANLCPNQTLMAHIRQILRSVKIKSKLL